MIISFTIENWMSYKDPVIFSMVASRERQHGERVPKIGKYQTRILPFAAIYGGNASGKTNFFKALNFVKNFVVRGTQPDSIIGVEQYLLDDTSKKKPTKFKIELLINEIIYDYSFSVTRKAVIDEKLIQISSSTEKIVFDRRKNIIEDQENLFNDNMFLKYAFQGTRDNQLFLTNSVFQKIDDFKPIYDWFKNSLVLIAPDERFSQFENFIDEKHPLYFIMNEILPQMDTGIKHLGSEEVQFENLLISREFKNKLQEELKEGASVRFVLKSTNDRIVVTRKNEKLIAKKLVSYHSKPEGKEAKFEIGQESDGTLRIIDLLPALLDASNPKNKKVYVIDEVDRSLHTILTKQLIESYLSSCSTETRSQLLITTHDVLLMDQNLLRRDEMWVAERNDSGISILFSFIDYKDVRYDKDIRKSYLQGRLGGTPKILLKNSFQKNGVTC